MFSTVHNKLLLSPRNLFLVDGLGALLTIFFLSGVLARFEEIFGMPKATLYYLSAIAVSFAIYSLSCYFLNVNNWRTYMTIIKIANLLYCCVTVMTTIYFLPRLTIFGITYFIIELILILGIVLIEQKMTPQYLRAK